MSISSNCFEKIIKKNRWQNLGFPVQISSPLENFNEFKKLDNKRINLIDVKYNFNKCFESISSKSNNYIEKTFKIALKIILQNKFSKFINGPISKKYFLKGKTLGITEYLTKKTNNNNNSVMLINSQYY